MDALGKEKVTKKKGHPTFWFLLRKNTLPQEPRMARMQKMQEQFSAEAILRVAVA